MKVGTDFGRAALATLIVLAMSGCSDNCNNYELSQSGQPSCEEETCIPTPPDCTQETPVTTFLNIHLSEPLPKVVKVYSGSAYETGTLILVRVPTRKDISESVPLGSYSVTALYVNGTDSTLAVDGGEATFRDVETCTRTCRVPDAAEVNLAEEQ